MVALLVAVCSSGFAIEIERGAEKAVSFDGPEVTPLDPKPKLGRDPLRVAEEEEKCGALVETAANGLVLVYAPKPETTTLVGSALVPGVLVLSLIELKPLAVTAVNGLIFEYAPKPNAVRSK